MTQEEGKFDGYTLEFFKEYIELEFIPKNSDHISRCKLHDLVNAANDNLHQYVKAYTKLMFEVRHIHKLDRMCHFVMGLLIGAKRKLEENWLASLSKAIMKMEGFLDVGRGFKFMFKKKKKILHKKAHHEGEWNQGQEVSKGEKPKQFQSPNFKRKKKFVKKGVPLKGSKPKGDANKNPK